MSNEIAEAYQVSVEQVANTLGIPTGRVYLSAWEQPVYIQTLDRKQGCLHVLPVEGIVQSVGSILLGVVRVNVNDKPVQLPVYFSPEEMVWRLHLKALQAHPELLEGGISG